MTNLVSGSCPAEYDDQGGVGPLLASTRGDLELSVLLGEGGQWTKCSLRFVDFLHLEIQVLCLAGVSPQVPHTRSDPHYLLLFSLTINNPNNKLISLSLDR